MRTAQVQVRFQIQFKYTVQVLPLYSRLFRQAGNTVGILQTPSPQGAGMCGREYRCQVLLVSDLPNRYSKRVEGLQ